MDKEFREGIDLLNTMPWNYCEISVAKVEGKVSNVIVVNLWLATAQKIMSAFFVFLSWKMDKTKFEKENGR